MQYPALDMPTPLDQLLAELNHTAKSSYDGYLFPVPTRLKAQPFAYVEALTFQSGGSRNRIMNHLVEVGIHATLQALPHDLVLKLNQRASDALVIGLERKAGTLEGSDE